MALTPGTRLGVYDITAQIGEGGMGQVWRATDTSLGRQVAIKILPEAFAADPDRLARFEREAKTLASLNHPHIAGIYAVEKSGGALALVMELVEGDDLSQRIARGAIPTDEALPIAMQIAEALEAAHEQGIIHRDLKPANIKVRADGTVKVLDFGLAKAMDGGGVSNSQLSHSPTMSRHMTEAGLIIGTAAYMSPEQAKGKAVDKRTDIWAFGVVLYEMLTGTRLFKGEDVSDTLAALLRQGVDFKALPADTPPSVCRLVARCLDRDLKHRLRDIGEARVLLENPTSSLVSDAAPASSSHDALSRDAPLWRRALPWATVAGVLGVALLASLLMWAPWRKAQGPTPRRLLASAGVDLWRGSNAGASAILSPDGTMLAMVGTRQGPRQLFVRKLDQLQAAPLVGTEGAESPFFSPDGQWIGFFANGKLKKVSVTGGSAVTLADASVVPRGAAWTDDDAIIFMPNADPRSTFLRVSAAGGAPAPFGAMGKGAVYQRWPQALPGGQALLYAESVSSNVDEGNLVVSSIKGDAPRIVVRGGYFGRYVSSGHLIYFSQGALFAVPFDLKRLEVMGQAVPALDDVAASSASGLLALSADGTLVYESNQISKVDRSLDWMTRDGRTSALSAKKVNWSNPRFSPDGQRLAITIRDADQEDIWLYDLASDNRTQLTFDPAFDAYPVWTPDGKRIVFSSTRDKAKGSNLYWTNADGTGEPTRLTESPNTQVPSSWHPGGNFLAFFENTPGNSYDLMILPMEGDAVSGLKPGAPTVFLSTKAAEAVPMFSPDGHWIAYTSNELGSTSFDVVVRPFPEKAGGPRRVSTGGGSWNSWSTTSPDLLFVTPTNKVMFAPYSVAGEAFTPGQPQLWSPTGFQPTASGTLSPYALHPDGKRVLLAAADAQDAPETRDKVVFYSGFGEYLKTIAPVTKP